MVLRSDASGRPGLGVWSGVHRFPALRLRSREGHEGSLSVNSQGPRRIPSAEHRSIRTFPEQPRQTVVKTISSQAPAGGRVLIAAIAAGDPRCRLRLERLAIGTRRHLDLHRWAPAPRRWPDRPGGIAGHGLSRGAHGLRVRPRLPGPSGHRDRAAGPHHRHVGPGRRVASGKVQRVALIKTGSTHVGSVGPFLTGLKNPPLLPSTAGGSVLIGDWTTGTIFRIAKSWIPPCGPGSQNSKGTTNTARLPLLQGSRAESFDPASPTCWDSSASCVSSKKRTMRTTMSSERGCWSRLGRWQRRLRREHP